MAFSYDYLGILVKSTLFLNKAWRLRDVWDIKSSCVFWSVLQNGIDGLSAKPLSKLTLLPTALFPIFGGFAAKSYSSSSIG